MTQEARARQLVKQAATGTVRDQILCYSQAIHLLEQAEDFSDRPAKIARQILTLSLKRDDLIALEA